MAVRIAVGNHKGGVGKSTTAMMVAEGLAHFHGARVLVFDFDPQASLSAMFLSSSGAYDAAVKGRTLAELLRQVATGRQVQLAPVMLTKVSDLVELRDTAGSGRVNLISSNSALLSRYRELEDLIRKKAGSRRVDAFLFEALEPELIRLEKSYDAIIFDCPAGSNALSLAAIRASEYILAPTVLDDISLRALGDYVRVILSEDLDVLHRLAELKVVLTMHVRSNPEQRRILDQIVSGAYNLNALPRPIGHSVSVHRAVTRLRPDSYRSAREKYGDALNDVASLAASIVEMINSRAKVTP